MREAQSRGEQLGLSEDEVAFYDALEVNDSAVQVLGDEKLKLIAQELVDTVPQVEAELARLNRSYNVNKRQCVRQFKWRLASVRSKPSLLGRSTCLR